jgi:ubiquinone/menaquinone biosynthesis C-methylase UbiE
MQNEVGESYNRWASQYDTNTNRTRDLEATALRELLSAARPERILEMGCGTGKKYGVACRALPAPDCR